VRKNTEGTLLWIKYFKGNPLKKKRDQSDKGEEKKVLRGGKIKSEMK